MGSKAGISLAVDGEKEFKTALAAINQSMRVLGSELTEVTARFAQNADSEEALTQKNQVLGKEIEVQKQKIDTLKKALEEATETYGAHDRATQEWQIQLNKAQAALHKMENEMSSQNAALEALSKEEDKAQDSTESMTEKLKESGDTAEKTGSRLSALGNVCKTAGAAMAASCVSIAGGLVSAGKALANMSVSGASFADTILTESTVTGLATDKLQEYMYAAELVDVSTETLTDSMAKNIKSMKSAADGSASIAEAYSRLGISVLDANGQLRDGDTVYWELIDALGQVENETERDALAMTLLGASAQDLNPLITAGSDRMAELGDKARKAGYVLSDELLNRYGALDDQIQYLSNSCTAAKNALGTVLLPVLTELGGEGVDLLNRFTTGIQDAGGDIGAMADVLGDILPQALDMVAAYLPTLLDMVGTVFLSVGQAMIDNLPLVVEAVSGIAGELLDTLSGALPQLADVAVLMVTTMIGGLSDALPQLVPAAVEMVQSLSEGLTQALPTLLPAVVGAVMAVCAELVNQIPTLLDTVLDILLAVADGLVQSVPLLIDALPAIITGLVEGLLSATPQIIKAGVTLLTSLVSDLPAILAAIARAIPQLIIGLIDTLFSFGANIQQAGTDLLSGLFSDPGAVLSGIGSYLKNLCVGIIGGLADGFRAAWDTMSEIGRNLLQGLWNGILSAKDWIVDKFKGLGQTIKDGFCDFFGIHSPSREMEWVGSMLTEGLAEGIDSTSTQAVKSANAMMRQIKGTIHDATVGMDMTVTTAAIPSAGMAAASAMAYGEEKVSIELHIEQFNNYSHDDIETLTQEIMETAGLYIKKKKAVFE